MLSVCQWFPNFYTQSRPPSWAPDYSFLRSNISLPCLMHIPNSIHSLPISIEGNSILPLVQTKHLGSILDFSLFSTPCILPRNPINSTFKIHPAPNHFSSPPLLPPIQVTMISHLGHCKGLLTGLPGHILAPLLSVLSKAARMSLLKY